MVVGAEGQFWWRLNTQNGIVGKVRGGRVLRLRIHQTEVWRTRRVAVAGKNVTVIRNQLETEAAAAALACGSCRNESRGCEEAVS